MTSTSTSTGRASVTLSFTNAADPDTAQMQVQNKLALVTSRLPPAVQDTGVTVSKSSTGFRLLIGFVSTDGKMSSTDLAAYVETNLTDTKNTCQGHREERKTARE